MAEQAELMRLLQASAQGNQQSFERLYQLTAPNLFGLCLRMLKSKERAEEVLQEAFVKVWHHASEYHQDRGQVTTWLTSIVRYRALDQIRSQKPTEPLSDDYQQEASDAPGPLDWTIKGTELNELQGCLDELNGQQKEAIILSFIEGLTHQELTERTDSPLGTIKSWIRRGLQSLKRCLAT